MPPLKETPLSGGGDALKPATDDPGDAAMADSAAEESGGEIDCKICRGPSEPRAPLLSPVRAFPEQKIAPEA